ncbi:MAG: helix-turn-helix domain-containing protein [Deltaproteobacteria bacterium]|nr:helix-turn-helix domain-containing protein [Deltaproteobacteria bacterium]
MPATHFDSGEFPFAVQAPIFPRAADRQPAQNFARALEELQRHLQPRRAFRLVDPDGGELEIPEGVFNLIREMAAVLARGDALTLIPLGQRLTTQQAASILNISRQYLIRLLEKGEIPYDRTGSHRRLRIEDVLAYRERRSQTRRQALNELVALSEECGGYDEPDPER